MGERTSFAASVAIEERMTRPALLQRTPEVLRWIVIAVAVCAVLAALGPFGSYMNGGPVERAGY